MKNSNSKNGFTLIELLVVVAILGFLSGIILQALGSSRIKSRNAARLTNIEQIIKGIEIGITGVENKLPYSGGIWKCIGKTSCWNATYTNNTTVDAVIDRGIKTPGIDSLFTASQYGDAVIYYSSWTGGIGASGVVFPAGAYVSWVMEDQTGAANEACGRGGWYNNLDTYTSKPSYQCMLRIGDAVAN